MNDQSASIGADGATSAPGPAQFWHPPRKDAPIIGLIFVLIAAAILAILYAWQLWPFSGTVQETDNAYVRGRTTIISPQVSGYVSAVPVHDFQQVAAGDILVRIDDAPYRAKVDQAQAALLSQMASLNNSTQSERSGLANEAGQQAAIANADAARAKAAADWDRIDQLFHQGWATRQEEDAARAALRQAQAQVTQAHANREVAHESTRSVIVGRSGLSAAVEGARAQLNAAKLDLGYTVVRAPEPGQLSEVGVRVGQYVTAGTQLMFLVPRDIWVTANFKEAQTKSMAVGQRATFRVDALGGREFSGVVDSLAPATGSEFSVIRPDNATGNFVKVAQRIAVRIRVNPGQPQANRLRPGMSVVARVYTRVPSS
jgi:multidrug resistance efflux pump